jgi:DNA-binding XRE family transcriptional regulator
MPTMDRFIEVLHERLPDATLSLDRPEKGGGSWWLDASLGDHSLVVEWKPSMGFGVSSLPSEGFGDGPDEFYDDEEEALGRVKHLLRTGERTKPAHQLALKRLREACQVTQTELARSMKVAQGAVSKLERRVNPSVTMLREWVRALGGELELVARFGDRRLKIEV